MEQNGHQGVKENGNIVLVVGMMRLGNNSFVSIECRLIFILILLMVCVCPVSADYQVTDTVEYQVADSKSFTAPGAGGSFPGGLADVTKFKHRFTNAKLLYKVIVKDKFERDDADISASNFTTFTAIVDGQHYGSGYVNVLDYNSIVWFEVAFTSLDIDYANSLTGDQIVYLTYDSSVLSKASKKGFNYANAGSLTTDKPSTFYITLGIPMSPAEMYVSYTTHYIQDFEYYHNSSTGFSTLNISKNNFDSDWSVHDLDDLSYFSEGTYSTSDLSQAFFYENGVYADVLFDVAGGVYSNFTIQAGSSNGGPSFEYNITTELDEYSPGDTVNVTYTTDQKGTIQVVKTISGDIYHSIGFVSGATNATWDFYIAGNEPYGFYDVHLLDSSNSILDTVRYSLLPTTSSLDILQSSVDLHETFVVFAQTVNESILSIEDPDGVEVWNESIGALMYDYIYYTPTIKTGIYTAYLYDDSTLNDTVMVYLADPPIIYDPLDPETNGSIVIEDVLDPDESMTEYYNEKFRDFAPTIWGFFMLMCLLFLMSILTSFNSGGKR